MSGFVSGGGGRGTGRRVAVVLACALLAVAVALLAPLVGANLDGHVELLGRGALDADSIDHQVLWIHIPRVLAALLVGGALAGAGCALQALLRNPLAEPYTLGISSGSALAAVVAIRLGLESALGGAGIGVAALVGAVTTLVIVWQLARVGRTLPPATLILAGVTLSMFCSAATVLIQATSDFVEVNRMLRWMLGDLDTMRVVVVSWYALPIGAGLLVLFAYARELDALSAGPEAAASVGVAVGRTQVVVFAASSLLVGAAIALAGPIGFVGLIVPHALRALIGPGHRALLPASVFAGGALLVACDTLARVVIAPGQLATGAVTAVLGAPFFVAIMVSQKRRAAMWS